MSRRDIYRGTLILLASRRGGACGWLCIEGAVDDGAGNRLRGSHGQRQRRQLHVLQSGIPGMGRPDRDPGRRHLGDAQDRAQELERIDGRRDADLRRYARGRRRRAMSVVPAFYAAVPLPGGRPARPRRERAVRARDGLLRATGSAATMRVRSELETININPAVAWRPLAWLSAGAGFQAQYADGTLTNADRFRHNRCRSRASPARCRAGRTALRACTATTGPMAGTPA